MCPKPFSVILLFCREVRLNEALENACTNVLDYKVHKDKIKALRYEKSKCPFFGIHFTFIRKNLPSFQVCRKDNFFEDKNVKGVLCGCFESVLPC